ncbi:MAG: hypothetical protein QOJ16_2750 [Acidobacteriota bacterium]|jgi:hypothetical protein|nr:hypothetical protein [Acidobacteriota bacterium]
MTEPTEPAVVQSPLFHRLRLAAVLMILGLLIEVVTLRSVHPFAFLSFAFFGMTLVGVAALLYLYAIVTE